MMTNGVCFAKPAHISASYWRERTETRQVEQTKQVIRKECAMLGKWTSLVSVVFVVGLTTSLPADTNWTGAVSNDWYDAANWTGVVPNSSERTRVESRTTLTLND
jgi:hypothetical protein